jgi:WD40 repeat protein
MTASLRASSSDIRVLTVLRDRVHVLGVLPDGRLVSGSGDYSDCTIKLWDLQTGQCQTTLEGHSCWGTVWCLLPDGRLASGSKAYSDDTFKLWNLQTGQCEATLEGHTSGVAALALLPDGRLASGSGDRTIAFLPTGRLASGWTDNTIKFWNVRTGECEATWEGHSGRRHPVEVVLMSNRIDGKGTPAVLPNERLLWRPHNFTINHSIVELWDLRTGEWRATWDGNRGWVDMIAVLPDEWLAIGLRDHTVRVRCLQNGSRSNAVLFVADADITSLIFAETHGVLVVGDASGRVHFLKLNGFASEPKCGS